jgi:hypothetical protein
MKRDFSEESTLRRREIFEGKYVILDAEEAGWFCAENTDSTPYLPLGAVSYALGCASMYFGFQKSIRSSGLPDVLYQLSS